MRGKIKENRIGDRDNYKKVEGGGGGDKNDYNGEYHRHHPPYSSSYRIEANTAEEMPRHLKEVSKRWQRVGRSV